MSTENRIFLKPNEVAERLGLSRSAVYKLIERGILPATHISTTGDPNVRGSVRIHRDDLDDWCNARRAYSDSQGS